MPITPGFLYGTAWKEDDTQALVTAALDVGFAGVDTANQRKHYHEAAVGEALRLAMARGLARNALFIQTKFTHRGGQDDRLPYDPTAPLATQVKQSFESSLGHLHTDFIDSYVLHGPSSRTGFPPEDWEVWRAMEAIHGSGRARSLGVSNVTLNQLEQLWAQAQVKPSAVQNRCYARTGWDRDVREFCLKHDLAYQGFSLLTANSKELTRAAITGPAERLHCTKEQVVFAFALKVGMVCLTGSSSPEHLRQDLAAQALELTPAEVSAIERV